MLRHLLFCLLLTLTVPASSQEMVITFNRLPGDSLREAGDLKAAIEAFKTTALTDPGNATNLYNLSCAYAILDQPDSAQKYFLQSLNIDEKLAGTSLTDPDFNNIKSTAAWQQMEDRAISAMVKKTGKPVKDLPYAKALWRMHALDQAYYNEIKVAEKKIGTWSTTVRALWDLKQRIGKENQQELESLIVKKGWPKQSEVGPMAANSAFLIIQHADDDKQKKYLPIIEKLCKEKEASWQSYALMYDRIQTNDGKPQKYGSQVKRNPTTGKYELFPLLDAQKVDEWRKEVGLGPLSDYVARWGIKLDSPSPVAE